MKSKKFLELLTTMILLVVVLIIIIGVYFYNTFVKFHLDYAELNNQNSLFQISEINNDMAKLSNSLFTNTKTNKFLNDNTISYNNDASKEIKSLIATSNMEKYISDLVVVTMSKNSVFELSSNRKYQLDDYLQKRPAISEFLDNNSSTVQQLDDFVYFSINDGIGHRIIIMVNPYILSHQALNNTYPLTYNTAVFTTNGELVISNYDVSDNICKHIINSAKTNSVYIEDNSVIIETNNSSAFTCISILKISEMFVEAFNTSSFLITLFLVLLILAGFIVYLFYYKHHDILQNIEQISEMNADLTVSLTMEKIFKYNPLTKSEEALLDRYFILCNASYFLPLTIDVSGISGILENQDVSDIMLYKYGFKNIISEVLEKRATVVINDIDKNLIGVILYSPNKFDIDLIRSDANHIEQVISEHFNLSPVVAIGIEQSDIYSAQKQLFQLTNKAEEYADSQDDTAYENDISSDTDSTFTDTVKKCIEKNFSDVNFCLSVITEELGLSAHYFGRKFKNNFGISFNQYLTNYRLNHSVELLINTNYSNKQITELCGFSSDIYFISVFKKKYGKSPKQYKSSSHTVSDSVDEFGEK